jgi:hypothetical protein
MTSIFFSSDVGDDRHAGAKEIEIRLHWIKFDADRQALSDFCEVTRCVIGGKKRKNRSARWRDI